MSDHPDLGEILKRIGAELAAQAECAEGLGDLVPLLPALDGALLARAQSIDGLVQHLSELSRLLDRLAPLAGGETVSPDVLASIRLADLADRLGGRGGAAPESGALDLF